jgi:hypothetical protein
VDFFAEVFREVFAVFFDVDFAAVRPFPYATGWPADTANATPTASTKTPKTLRTLRYMRRFAPDS